ncbi:TPA: hypothetical protein SMO11_000111 [Pseudomonas aeruginosa]|nr:hypothetical protein [Pseudomonas aeruginosa]HEJ9974916.1 hypothetical protein [Pseudomonas aeruginosa]HEJ9985955.1 hypothetical protein [Pseudomonas aeruginosa]
MTTPISDEQLAEIERDILAQAQIMSGQCEGGVWLRGGDCPKCQATRHDRCQFPLSQSYAIPSNVEALIARLRAAEPDAKRWRHARNILTVEAIESAQSDYINFGLPPAESESIRADQAIDAAMERTP